MTCNSRWTPLVPPVLVVLFGVSCTLRLTPATDTQITCKTNLDCPTGWSCSKSRCLAPNAAKPEGVAPEIITPESGARFRVGNVRLAWTARALAQSHTLEVSTDSEFRTQLPNSPFTLPATTTDFEISVTSPVRHYARVRSDTSDDGSFGQVSFEVLGDHVYVYCAADDDCTSQQTHVGNASSPARSVAQGISIARTYGINEVRVAGRGGDSVYREGILDIPSGMTLRGGYSADFAVQDSILHPTHIVGTSLATIQAAQLTAATLLHGLHIVGPEAGGEDESVAVYLRDTADHLLISDCVIEGGRVAGGKSYGVRISTTDEATPHRPEIKQSSLLGGDSSETFGESYGLASRKAAPFLHDNFRIVGGAGGTRSSGLMLGGGAAIVEDNAEIAGGQAWFSSGINSANSGLTLRRNGIVRGGDLQNASVAISTGVELSGADAPVLIEDSIISGGTVSAATQARSLALSATTAEVHVLRSTLRAGNVVAPASVSVSSCGATHALYTYGGDVTVSETALEGGTVPASLDDCDDYPVAPVYSPSPQTRLTLSTVTIGVPSNAYWRVHGVVCRECDSLILESSELSIAAQSEATLVTGVVLEDLATLSLMNNQITLAGGSLALRTAIDIRGGNGSITRQRIKAEDIALVARGLLMRTPSFRPGELMVANNVIDAGPATTLSEAARIENTQSSPGLAHSTWLVHNTLIVRAEGSSDAIGLRINEPVGTTLRTCLLVNNLIGIEGSGAGTTACVRQDGASEQQPPTTRLVGFHSNALVGCAALFCDNGSTCQTTTGDVNALSSSHSGTIASMAPGWQVEAWSLTSATPDVICEGGRDTQVSTCGTGTTDCGHTTTDIDGNPRTCAMSECVSVGAHERDGPCSPP